MIFNKHKSLNWLRDLFLKSKKQSYNKVITLVGKLAFLSYDPKTKDTLDYYDSTPLIFVVKIEGPYIYGLNVHYLDLSWRAKLVQSLCKFGPSSTEDEINLEIKKSSLSKLPQNKLANLCLKKYLIKNIKNMIIISNEEWNNILYLPVYDFKKKSVNEVWQITSEKAAE